MQTLQNLFRQTWDGYDLTSLVLFYSYMQPAVDWHIVMWHMDIILICLKRPVSLIMKSNDPEKKVSYEIVVYAEP